MRADLLDSLAAARRVLVLSGAGMSAESGIPTFRDAQTGMWARFRPEELATPEAFERQPETVWNWYQERRTAVRKARPHAGHEVLASWPERFERIVIATQNVDGLHQAAGSDDVLELHGNILRSVCNLSRRPISEEWIRDDPHVPPRSPYVKGGLARPDVTWFGEALPVSVFEQALDFASRCDFCFSIGTTSLVQPAASLPMAALERGIPVVEINPQETPLSLHAAECIREPASTALMEIEKQLSTRL